MKVQEYDLPFETGRVTLRMPLNTEVLSVTEQQGKLVLRARGKSATYETRVFAVVETGGDMQAKDMYVGRAYLDGGARVFDVFEVTG